MFAPACLSHEVITRKWVKFTLNLLFHEPSCVCFFLLWPYSALMCCDPATGLMCRLKAPLCLEPFTAGTAASMTAGTTRRHPKLARCIWLTTAPGLTATPPARPSGTNSQGKRWVLCSSSCTWALTCRRWPNSRAWTRANYWACSAVAAKRDTQSYLKLEPSRTGHSTWPVSHNWYLCTRSPLQNPLYCFWTSGHPRCFDLILKPGLTHQAPP